jgi:hypothetical protein
MIVELRKAAAEWCRDIAADFPDASPLDVLRAVLEAFLAQPDVRSGQQKMEAGVSPQRIQRKRTKGWRMPEGAVYVGRPTMWGNPFFASVMGADRAVEYFRQWAEGQGDYVRFARRELAGKSLACWCPLDVPCHADVLLEIANQQKMEAVT